MSVLNYIKNVNEGLKAKHIGDTFFYFGGAEPMQLTTRAPYEILAEIDGLKGLFGNKKQPEKV